MLSLAYEVGVDLALRDAGLSEQVCRAALSKEAGLKELMRFITTGRVTAYHGTVPGAAAAIREAGLIPSARPGVVAHKIKKLQGDPTGGQTLSFLTRQTNKAKGYAKQQAYLEATGKRPQEILQDLKGPGTFVNTARDLWRGWRAGRIATRKGIVEARIPLQELKPIRNPELDTLSEKLLAQTPYPEPVTKTISGLVFGDSFALAPRAGTNVALAPTRIVGSPSYSRVTLPEIKEHVIRSVKNPKDTLMEALRSATGFQTLL
jgi:hypothetical protein